MTERERTRDGEINDLVGEYPKSPAVSGPTTDKPVGERAVGSAANTYDMPEQHDAQRGATRTEPLGERPIGGSAKTFEAPDQPAGGTRALWVIALLGVVTLLLIVLVWAIGTIF